MAPTITFDRRGPSSPVPGPPGIPHPSDALRTFDELAKADVRYVRSTVAQYLPPTENSFGRYPDVYIECKASHRCDRNPALEYLPNGNLRPLPTIMSVKGAT